MILLVVLFTVDVVVVVALVLPPTYFIRFFFGNVDPFFRVPFVVQNKVRYRRR